jgi:hypothetical protein
MTGREPSWGRTLAVGRADVAWRKIQGQEANPVVRFQVQVRPGASEVQPHEPPGGPGAGDPDLQVDSVGDYVERDEARMPAPVDPTIRHRALQNVGAQGVHRHPDLGSKRIRAGEDWSEEEEKPLEHRHGHGPGGGIAMPL